MYDELDKYLKRSLKNWVASYPTPKNGRKRLLQDAASGVESIEVVKELSLFEFLVKYLVPQKHGYQFAYPLDEFVLQPISQSRVWSWELTSTWRLAL